MIEPERVDLRPFLSNSPDIWEEFSIYINGSLAGWYAPGYDERPLLLWQNISRYVGNSGTMSNEEFKEELIETCRALVTIMRLTGDQ